jgi:Ca2+/H+ antiporter
VNFAHSASEDVAKKIGQKLGSVVLGMFVKVRACLTNSALVYEPKCGWGGEDVAGSLPVKL